MNKLKDIVKFFDDEMKFVFNSIDDVIVDRITEIRVRKNRAIAIVIRNSTYFIDYNGDIYDYPHHNAVVVSSKQFDELFLRLCDYSIYSSMEAMKQGYITLNNGSRVGIASSCVYDRNTILSVKDITSLNIRIPQQISGCANDILNCLYVNSFPSIIIAGAPNSGKTTLLRDVAYQLSNGFNDRYYKVSVVDERNEISAKINDNYSFELGINTDVLTGFSKAKGIEIATRTLSPDMIICDEISTFEELESIKFGFASGVSFALSVHIASSKNVYDKTIIQKLIETKEFDYIVVLDEHTYKTRIIDVNEKLNEINRTSNSCDIINRDWSSSFK